MTYSEAHAGRTKAAPAGWARAARRVLLVTFVHGQTLILWVLVSALVLARVALTGHMALEWEEPLLWSRIPAMSPLAYLVDPWAGYLSVPARAAYLAAYPFGEAGPLVTRILGALVVGATAALVASRYGVPAGLALAFLPISEPYVGPLNAQWWLALALVVIALSPAHRWHWPAIVAAGLSGVGACVAVLAFRDRRGLALLAVGGLHAAYLLTSDRRPGALGISAEFALVAALCVLSLAVSRLPRRDRLAWGAVALATIALGSWTTGGVDGGWRYLTAAWFAVYLGLLSAVARIGRGSWALQPSATT